MPGAARPWVVGLAVVALLALAGWLRIDDLGHPDRIYFDETYYVNDARSYLERGVEAERPAHPPLGKWVIAAGTAAFGDEPFGWRIGNALAGTLTVGLVLAGGRLLTRAWWPALLAGLLVAVEGLSFVGSRIAMLDASLALWITAGFVLLVVDARGGAPSSFAPSWWRVAAAAVLGLAVATKWSGALALAAGFVVAAATELRWYRARRHEAPGAPSPPLGRYVLRLVLPFAVVPAAAYFATYVPWLANYPNTETAEERCEEGECGAGIDDRLAGLWREHAELVAFHRRLEVSHSARAEPWRWPVLDRPVLFFLERCRPDPSRCPFEPGEERRIIGLGSPALWWPALVLVPALAVVGARRRSWEAGAVLAFLLLQWLPWFLVKPGFSFYLIPVAPFAALAVAVLFRMLPVGIGRWFALAFAAVAVSAFVLYRPLLVGSLLDEERRDRLALLPSWD